METEIKTLNIDEGYKATMDLLLTARRVADMVKPEFEKALAKEYNPFVEFQDSLESEALKLREHLINLTAAKYRTQYMPNVKPDTDFKKLMDTEAGKRGFLEDVIKCWFENAIKDKKALELQSLEHLQQEVSQLIPYGNHEGGWGKPKNPEALVKGRFLRLRAYTWDSRLKYVSAYNIWEALTALDKLISVAAGEYSTITTEPLLNLRIHTNTTEPTDFYKKITANDLQHSHPTVKSFRFYKNDSFEVEFKTPAQAEAVARLLLLPF